MKILFLLPFLLLSACTQADISSTSELGEKVVVKRNTILPKEDYFVYSNENAASQIENYELIIEHSLQMDPRDVREGEVDYYQKQIDGLKLKISLDEAGEWLQVFRYRPINIDLNGVKTPGVEQKVKCVDPSLSKEIKLRLSYVPKLEEQLAVGDKNTVEGDIHRQICNEYAKW